MSKRAERREAERIARKKAYQELRQAQRAQSRERAQPSSAAVPVTQPAEDPFVKAQAFVETKPEISEAQLNANRANAKLSTGPSSESGKETSSRNNLRHGLTQSEGDLILLESESPEQYNQNLAAFQAEWQPETPTEHDLVERLASRQWLRRRAMKLQTLYLAPDGQISDEKKFALYRRYEVQHERAYNKALSDLMRLHSLRRREQNGFESQRRKEEVHAFKVKALQDREYRNQLANLEAERRLSLAEMRLNNQRVDNLVKESRQTAAQPARQAA